MPTLPGAYLLWLMAGFITMWLVGLLYEHSMARFAVTEQKEVVGRKLVVVKGRVKLLMNAAAMRGP